MIPAHRSASACRASAPGGILESMTDRASRPALTAHTHTRRRPHAVTFVALLSGVEGLAAIALVGGVGAVWFMQTDEILSAELVQALDDTALLGVAGVMLLVSSAGLLLLRRWAWTWAMATQCLTLTITLYEYLSGDPDYLVMALGVLAALLLNLQEVRVAFEPASGQHG